MLLKRDGETSARFNSHIDWPQLIWLSLKCSAGEFVFRLFHLWIQMYPAYDGVSLYGNLPYLFLLVDMEGIQEAAQPIKGFDLPLGEVEWQ